MEDMSPFDWAVLPVKKYGVFSGRAPRAEYWWFQLTLIVGGFLLDYLGGLIGLSDWLGNIFNLALLVPVVAVTVRRLHDINRTGWWMLIMLGLIVGSIAVATISYSFNGGTAGGFATGILLVLVFLGVAVTWLVFMILPGTEGPNRYGADPYGPDELEQVFA